MSSARSLFPVASAFLLAAIAPVAFGQSAPGQTPTPPTYNGTREVVDGAHIPPIPGVSFSAKAEVQTTQTLADGTTVTHRTFNTIARDYRGRTHNEMRAWIASADGSEPKLTYSIIYDPGTRARTLLYPSAKLARQFIFKPPSAPVTPPDPAVANPLAPSVQKEDLGSEFKDGMQLTGSRETRSYPAGSIGNDRPIAITNEYWYAPDLHINISVRRADPRFGTQSVQLTELRREEPDASLFEVPADYKLVNENTPAGSGAVPDGNSGPFDPNMMRLRVGGNVQAAKIINRVQPVYPIEARRNGIQGTVRLHVILQKDGTVEQLEVVSGHPLLAQAAHDAVRQWRYQPTLLNGQPVMIDTTIDVIFTLNILRTNNP
jgi:TonB family protein